ncbi:MAG: aldo/keto reductase [Bacteroidota bacterium]|nr:aldo/keto reductase [Bacteroidota bacterium]
MDFKNLTLYKPRMEYRRFGKTNKMLSVITLGGMRYKHGWNAPRQEVPDETLEECRKTVETALSMGINHIETAYGYMKSEHTYGIVLNDILKLKRDSYYLMTKGAPTTAEETRRMVESQLKALKTDYFDFYAWHGLNNADRFQKACHKNGPVEELLKMKEEGIIGHVGFSTHGPLEVIIKAIETDMFEFMNLHYYYFFQRNKGAIDLAQAKDMGVFIISPNDKGGQLSTPPQKLKDLTAPLTPLQWNARFCLSNPAIHTLSFGFPATSPFNQVDGIFPVSSPLSEKDAEIKFLLDKQRLLDKYAGFDGYCMNNDPSGINIPEVLRFRTLLKCYDMEDFCKYRYNMFIENDPWFAGAFPTAEKLAQVDLSRCPKEIPILDLLAETHEALYVEPKKN